VLGSEEKNKKDTKASIPSHLLKTIPLSKNGAERYERIIQEQIQNKLGKKFY